MQTTIRKGTIINAIMTENLRSQAFIASPDGSVYNNDVSLDPKCAVCAVGALLRAAGATNEEIGKLGTVIGRDIVRTDANAVNKEVRLLLAEKKYLNALSVKFEGLFDSDNPIVPTKADRKRVAAFVRRTFPEKLELRALRRQAGL